MTRLRARVIHAWQRLEQVADQVHAGARLHEAWTQCCQGERRHRSMGKGLSTYALSVEDAARLLMLQKVHEGSSPPVSWEEACAIRVDCALAYSVHESLAKAKRLSDAFPDPAFMKIDYAGDVARPA